MIFDYWGELYLNYYIEVVFMLFCVCECVINLLEEGIEVSIKCYKIVGDVMLVGI